MQTAEIDEATQLSFDDVAGEDLPAAEPQPTGRSVHTRRVHRHVRPDRFARRVDNRISVLCRDLPPSAEPVLRAVVSAMAGSNSCRFSYPAFVEVSSVSLSSFKRMIPKLREAGLLMAFTRDGTYVPPGTNVRAMLTLKLGPMFELAQPDLESRENPQLALRSGAKQTPALVSDRDQPGASLSPAPPTQTLVNNKEAPSLDGGASLETTPDGAADPEGPAPTDAELRAGLAQARAALKDRPVAECHRCGQPIEPGKPHDLGGTICPG